MEMGKNRTGDFIRVRYGKSKGDLSSRIDALSFIITGNMKCKEIIQKEFSYTPSLAMVVNPIVQLALEMMKKLDN